MCSKILSRRYWNARIFGTPNICAISTARSAVHEITFERDAGGDEFPSRNAQPDLMTDVYSAVLVSMP